jgi:hypothetical protein
LLVQIVPAFAENEKAERAERAQRENCKNQNSREYAIEELEHGEILFRGETTEVDSQ